MAPTGKDVLLVVLQVAPAVIISAGINFAVAYAMYHSQSNINFWPFPNTIAGDLAVTNFIQGALNYIVPSATLEADSRLGKAVPWRGLWNPPLSLVDRISRLSGRKRQLWELLVQSEDILAPPLRPKTVFKKLFLAILRGLFLSVFLFLITWSLAVAIACPIYCGDNIAGTWAKWVCHVSTRRISSASARTPRRSGVSSRRCWRTPPPFSRRAAATRPSTRRRRSCRPSRTPTRAG